MYSWICEILHIWRLLHWCWVTQHIWLVLSIREHPLMSWKLTMNLFSPKTKSEWQTSLWDRCVESLNISVMSLNRKIFTNTHRTLTFCPLQNYLLGLNNLFMVMFQLIRMSSYARTNYRCVESLNISVEVAKCGKYSQIHPVTFCLLQKMTSPMTRTMVLVLW